MHDLQARTFGQRAAGHGGKAEADCLRFDRRQLANLDLHRLHPPELLHPGSLLDDLQDTDGQRHLMHRRTYR
ncbi:MAG: hypothetical protein AW12_02270 [Candidatus Accumulibacter sp. BA-94]|nr:MAG: hypothetical protein AW12_02270 [Candidatus Accumulibacter sp. BA-94]